MLTAIPVADAEAVQRELALEASALARFVELLGREQGALRDQGIEEMNGLVADKSRGLEELSLHTAQRERRLKTAGFATDAAGMRAWLARYASTPAIAGGWSRVTALAEQARQENEINGRLVSIQMQRTGRQLDFLNRMALNEPTYCADGVARADVRMRSLGEA